jgi:hypothetical protein
MGLGFRDRAAHSGSRGESIRRTPGLVEPEEVVRTLARLAGVEWSLTADGHAAGWGTPRG